MELLLRPWAEADTAALREAIDEDVDHLRPWLSWTLEEPATPELTRARLRGYIEQFRAGTAFRFAVVPLDGPSCILGGAHLHCRADPAAHAIGYWVRKSAVRQGIAAAVVARLTVHAFEERRVHRLVVRCDVANQASARFARSLAFRFVGPVAGTYPDGSERPLFEFQMTLEDYRARRARPLHELARRVHLAWM